MPSAKHHFQAENVLTGHAVADHPVAAGVGRQAATDDRAATRAPVQREQKALVAGSLLDDLDRRAGQRGEGGGSTVHLLDAAHAFEGECDLTGGWNGGPGKSGEAALGNYRGVELMANGERRGDFLGASRPQQRDRLARRNAAPILAIAWLDRIRDDDALFQVPGPGGLSGCWYGSHSFSLRGADSQYPRDRRCETCAITGVAVAASGHLRREGDFRPSAQAVIGSPSNYSGLRLKLD